jgi:tRNA-binding protein
MDVRVGTIVSAEAHQGARVPSLVLVLDFGGLGRRTASVTIADLYEAKDLVGLQAVAVLDAPPRQVAGVRCDAHVLTVDDGRGEAVLLIPERPVPDGQKAG